MAIKRALPENPMLFEVRFIGSQLRYAIEEPERVVGISFVEKVRDIFGAIPLNQISCVIPYRLDIDISLIMGYNTAKDCVRSADGKRVFEHCNQLVVEVGEGFLNFNEDPSSPTNDILRIDPCRRPWSTADEFKVDHNPLHKPDPPFFNSTTCVYFPCWQINAEKLFNWWKNELDFAIDDPWQMPVRYDFIYAFYKTTFGGTGEKLTSIMENPQSTPVPYPFDQTLGDIWTDGFVYDTKCIEGHMETFDDITVPDDCSSGTLIEAWKIGSSFYYTGPTDCTWYVEDGTYVITGYPGFSADFETFLSGTDHPGRYYEVWDEADDRVEFKGWQLMCCDRFITHYYWVTQQHRLPWFLAMWFRYNKVVETHNELSTHQEPWEFFDPAECDF